MFGPFSYGVVSQGGAVPWYLTGGAPTPVVVYNVREGGSLVGSKINVVNPGTNDAAGVNPTWSGVTGWGFNGTTQYLTTGIVPAGSYSMLIRFASITVSGRFLCGVTGAGAASHRFLLSSTNAGDTAAQYNNTSGNTGVGVAPGLSTGVLAIAGTAGYRNGVSEAVLPGNAAPTGDIYVGGYNLNGVVGAFCQGNILYFAVWDTSTGHATWMPQVSAAVAAL